MAAPPGFDPTASVLPDPGASSAPIHVMKGGGMKSGDRESILKAYRLAPGQELSSKFSEKEKEAFVEALKSGGCNWSAKSVLDSKCAPVVNVLKALLGQKIKRVNAVDIPEDVDIGRSQGSRLETMSRPFPNLFKMGRPTQYPLGRGSRAQSPFSSKPSSNATIASEQPNEAPIVIVNEDNNSGPIARNSNVQIEVDMNNNDVPFSGFKNTLFETTPTPGNQLNQNVFKRTLVNSAKTNYRGNKSRRTANIRLNLTRKNKRVFSNFNINSKPTRIYGNSPQNIAKRYNYELAKSKKNAQKRAENAERTKRNTQVRNQKLAWEKQAQKQTVKSIKSGLNEQIAALRAEKKSLPQTKKFYEFWKGGKKTRRGNRK